MVSSANRIVPNPSRRRGKHSLHRQQKDGQPLPHLLGLTLPSFQQLPRVASWWQGWTPPCARNTSRRQALATPFQSPMRAEPQQTLMGTALLFLWSTTQPPTSTWGLLHKIRGRFLVQGGCRAAHHWCFRKHSGEHMLHTQRPGRLHSVPSKWVPIAKETHAAAWPLQESRGVRGWSASQPAINSHWEHRQALGARCQPHQVLPIPVLAAT